MPQAKTCKFSFLMHFGIAVLMAMPAISRAEDALQISSTAASESRTGSAETLALLVDFAFLVQIDGEIGSIVLGNASIADAMVADGTMIVVTGKSEGMTNMIVLDATNQILAQMTLQVSGHKPGTVTVRRALELQSYACSTVLCRGNESGEVDASAESILAPL